MSLGAQFIAFLISFGIGIGAAFFFDFYRVTRRALRLSRWGTGIGDLLVWIVLTCLVFGLLLLVNWGEVRWYILLGLALGAAFYYRALSRGGQLFWKRLWDIAGRIIRVLIRPLVFAGRLVKRLVSLPVRPFIRLRALFRRRRAPQPPPAEDE